MLELFVERGALHNKSRGNTAGVFSLWHGKQPMILSLLDGVGGSAFRGP